MEEIDRRIISLLCEDGRTRLLDDVIGLRFAVIAWGTDPTWAMDDGTRAFWERLGTCFVSVRPAVQMPHAADVSAGVVRVGDLGNRLKDWFAKWPDSVVILRPDRFVGATCTPQTVVEASAAFARAMHATVGA